MMLIRITLIILSIIAQVSCEEENIDGCSKCLEDSDVANLRTGSGDQNEEFQMLKKLQKAEIRIPQICSKGRLIINTAVIPEERKVCVLNTTEDGRCWEFNLLYKWETTLFGKCQTNLSPKEILQLDMDNKINPEIEIPDFCSPDVDNPQPLPDLPDFSSSQDLMEDSDCQPDSDKENITTKMKIGTQFKMLKQMTLHQCDGKDIQLVSMELREPVFSFDRCVPEGSLCKCLRKNKLFAAIMFQPYQKMFPCLIKMFRQVETLMLSCSEN